MENINTILTERTSQHGDFSDVAKTTNDFNTILTNSINYDKMTSSQRVGLYMVLHKIARICCGDPNLKDHYTDMIGYTQLMLDRLK